MTLQDKTVIERVEQAIILLPSSVEVSDIRALLAIAKRAPVEDEGVVEALRTAEIALRLDRERMEAKGMSVLQNGEAHRKVVEQLAAMRSTPEGGE